ncbi:tetratricopeptide repeat protein [Myxococcota bacterium]|jgi:hypothetical protein|nr:tetratricopeptide repeat protein [Myxococcota bacterium]
MRTAATCLLMGILASTAARAGTLENRFQEGVEALRGGRPGDAAEAFRELAERYRLEAPEVLLNLAVAEFEAGHPGPAIAALHRVIRLDPEGPLAETARINLARARAILSEEAGKGPNAFVFSAYADAWTLLAGWIPPALALGVFAVLWWLFLAGLALYRWPGSGSFRRFLAGPVVALGIGCLVAGGLALASDRVSRYTVGVVVEPRTGLLPDPTALEPSLRLPEGLEVRVLEVRGGMARVRLSSGSEGYLPERSLAIP